MYVYENFSVPNKCLRMYAYLYLCNMNVKMYTMITNAFDKKRNYIIVLVFHIFFFFYYPFLGLFMLLRLSLPSTNSCLLPFGLKKPNFIFTFLLSLPVTKIKRKK